MQLERGQLIEIVASIAAVGGFVVALVTIGLLYNQSELAPTGGLALVGAIAMFIIVMSIVGYVLADLDQDED